jgi:hypothetical protein
VAIDKTKSIRIILLDKIQVITKIEIPIKKSNTNRKYRRIIKKKRNIKITKNRFLKFKKLKKILSNLKIKALIKSK